VWDRLPGTGDPKEITDRIAKLEKIATPKYTMADLPKEAMSWAVESKKVAEDWVYRKAGPGSDWLSTIQSDWNRESYLARCRPIADQRIHLAGIRLAAVLNAIFEN
jgi:S1/P1 Nuclease